MIKILDRNMKTAMAYAYPSRSTGPKYWNVKDGDIVSVTMGQQPTPSGLVLFRRKSTEDFVLASIYMFDMVPEEEQDSAQAMWELKQE